MNVYDRYRATLTPSNEYVLLVGHVRSIALPPGRGVHVPLFDELTPALAAEGPYPLYALAAVNHGAHRDRSWCLVPAYLDRGSPACMRVHAAFTPLRPDRAQISESVYAALLVLEGDLALPASMPVHSVTADRESTSTAAGCSACLRGR
ncbi:hypothetical protein [Nocardia sp. NPDC047038]|uniref:hypothetical protein n=1 Tax=Nocardia sp. NPDC047038 TaxID=3154338 RepID=UPI0033FBB029